MAYELVFDIETIGDINNQSTMEVTVASCTKTDDNSTFSFTKDELNGLFDLMLGAKRIIGFNSKSFDLPILQKYSALELSKLPHLDLLEIVKKQSGRRYKLDDLVKATLQKQKSADGLQAMKWFEEGKIDEIKKYCEQDVLVTRELYDFGVKNRMIYYPTLQGGVMPIPVNFDFVDENLDKNGMPVPSGMNLTLGF
jgi:DEAD/DEAH box helicase domain-containing protein